MTFIEYLTESFGLNEPIFSSDIKFENYSKPWIDKQLAELCENGNLVRFERGIYYIPVKTPFGNSLLNPNKVIERKYIMYQGKASGFYSGLTALNRLELSTQMPNSIEICTNNETTKLRNIKVGSCDVTLRRSRVKITNENLNVVSFLELMNTIPRDIWTNSAKQLSENWYGTAISQKKCFSDTLPNFPIKQCVILWKARLFSMLLGDRELFGKAVNAYSAV